MNIVIKFKIINFDERLDFKVNFLTTKTINAINKNIIDINESIASGP